MARGQAQPQVDPGPEGAIMSYNPRQPRDRHGRWKRTGSGKKYGRRGAVIGAALLVGGPVYMPVGAGVGYAAGRYLGQRRR